MIDQFTNLEPDGDFALPTSSLDLSARMRELRARAGLKQSEVARRIGLDPSIPSLWEQGKRLVPANRVRALANALEVSVEELLEGVSGAGTRVASSRFATGEGLGRGAYADLVDEYGLRGRSAESGPLLRLLPQAEEQAAPEPEPEPEPEPWVIAERPPLVGWIPEGWEPSDRVQDISPALPDGYWIDPVKLERPTPRRLLRSRLCADDAQVIGDQAVPGAALAERIYQHCSRQPEWLPAGRLPLVEALFRYVLGADHGGLTDGALLELLGERGGAVPVSVTLLRRLRDSVRPYPIRRADADLFGGRR